MCVKHLPRGDAQQMIVLIIMIPALVVNADTGRRASSTSWGSAVNEGVMGSLGQPYDSVLPIC